jgi:hypothetical protein
MQIWYILYLLTYSYVLLFKYKSSTSFSRSEAFMYMWQLSFMLETVRVVSSVKISSWRDRLLVFVRAIPKQLDFIAVVISVAAFALRWSCPRAIADNS